MTFRAYTCQVNSTVASYSEARCARSLAQSLFVLVRIRSERSDWHRVLECFADDEELARELHNISRLMTSMENRTRYICLFHDAETFLGTLHYRTLWRYSRASHASSGRFSLVLPQWTTLSKKTPKHNKMADTALPPSDLDHPNKDQRNRLAAAKTSIKFMLDPKTGPQPAQLHTRAFLRSLRYVTIFLFWRLVRYAKYAAVGAVVAAVGSTAVGSVLSGAAFVVAPTGILGGAGVGLLWAVARFGWKRASARIRRADHAVDADPRKDEHADAEGVPVIRPPRTDPCTGATRTILQCFQAKGSQITTLPNRYPAMSRPYAAYINPHDQSRLLERPYVAHYYPDGTLECRAAQLARAPGKSVGCAHSHEQGLKRDLHDMLAMLVEQVAGIAKLLTLQRAVCYC
nr:hypothetical protein CFP56_12214 [Quercus suber]